MSNSNATSGFIDLATYDELDKYMYGGADATAYFVRETRKSTWFTQVPVTLSNSSGTASFGNNYSVNISRVGDYLLQAWLRVTLGAFTVAAAGVGNIVAASAVRWTRNFMHNLIKTCKIQFNDMLAEEFNSYNLDFWAAFSVPRSKQGAYDAMIGNTAQVIGQVQETASSTATTLMLPLPFFFSRDSGVALPTAALPYNDMRISFEFRTVAELLVHQNNTTNAYVALNPSTDLTTLPTLSAVAVWGNYAIVSNDERKRMACAPRDILIEQFESANQGSGTTLTAAAAGDETQVDIRFSHAVKLLMFGARSVGLLSGAAEFSNYSSTLPAITAVSGSLPTWATGLTTEDPLDLVSLTYENTTRLSAMDAEYFSCMQPYYQPGAAVPEAVGYHMYSYALDFLNVDPTGSTNYGRLTQVSMKVTVTATAAALSGTFKLHVMNIHNNIVRVSGGAMGFPVL
jgi:hypothetical protein